MEEQSLTFPCKGATERKFLHGNTRSWLRCIKTGPLITLPVVVETHTFSYSFWWHSPRILILAKSFHSITPAI